MLTVVTMRSCFIHPRKWPKQGQERRNKTAAHALNSQWLLPASQSQQEQADMGTQLFARIGEPQSSGGDPHCCSTGSITVAPMLPALTGSRCCSSRAISVCFMRPARAVCESRRSKQGGHASTQKKLAPSGVT